MAYPLTGSTLTSSISTGLSTQILIKVANENVGAMQRLEVRHNRQLERVKEIGTDGVIEIVPNRATEYEATLNRIVFDQLSLPEAFARGFVNIKSQTIPFEIVVIDRTGGEDEGAITHTFANCWFNSLSTTYEADRFIIAQQGQIWFEDVRSTLGTSDANAANGGARGINFQVNERERQTDRGSGGVAGSGGFRGSLDVSNLIGQVFE